ncbi:MAG: DUF5060 domain-containing protein [Clostridia bacterium]|nr:DUF5060 domain-containing protein [Clostridia bacterium]
MSQIEKWGVFETAVNGKSEGNPFLDHEITGTFTGEHETVKVNGFYDGEGVYRVRFMPSYEGRYTYTIEGSAVDAPVMEEFEAISAMGNNHGPVRVVDETLLTYADGTPHYSMGTTCYAWVNQSMELQEQTLDTLSQSPFNKIRFCVFPKFYEFNRQEPVTYPFERGHGEGLDPALVEIQANRTYWPLEPVPEMDYGFDYTRPNVEHFQRFDLRIKQLMELGIEADIILMHPYDRWGMNEMDAAACDAYLKYMVARYGAFRNVWWSLANEYDTIPTKTPEDWERYGLLIAENDPYHHLCSVHNCITCYDFSKPWVTHQSLQRTDFYKTTEYTDAFIEKYHKPAVWDEICYEGDISLGWGNITAQELVRRFWEAFLRGGHAGHGETYLDENDGRVSERQAEPALRGSAAPEEGRRQPVLWWSHGGILKGDSASRIAFLKKILEETPGRGLRKTEGIFDEVVGCAVDAPQDYQIHYLGICQPKYRMLVLPEDGDFEVEIIDTWNMTITSAGNHRGATRIELPGNQYMAIRVRRV